MQRVVVKMSGIVMVCFWAGSTVALAGDASAERLANWPEWRGPLSNGVAPQGDPPVKWDQKTNVKWKTEIPGQGSSSPIVWGNQIFVTTAVKTDETVEPPPEEKPVPEAEGEGRRGRGGRGDRGGRGARPGGGQGRPNSYYEFLVYSIDRDTGKVLWKKTATRAVPHEGTRQDNGYASMSATTDGKQLYVSFGSRGMYCFDLEGNLKWDRDLGDMRMRNAFGEGASPAVYGDTFLVTWDHEEQSFIAALDTQTGKTKWKMDRDEPSNWSTPIVVEHNGKEQVIVNAAKRVRSYDLKTGDLIWECGGQTMSAIPMPVTADGVVYCMSGFRGSAAFAIPLDATGDITLTDKPIWRVQKNTPYVPSPLLLDDQLYFVRGNTGILTSLNAKTGKVLIDGERLPDVKSVYASPVGAADRVYLTSREGVTVVLKHGPKFEILATNDLEEPIDASPAIVGKQLFLRGAKHLYCIATN
jgi:outer membrane protein assembly factor BamB